MHSRAVEQVGFRQINPQTAIGPSPPVDVEMEEILALATHAPKVTKLEHQSGI